MSRPKPNMTESILARAELFRRGMLFDGVPQMSATELEVPAQPALPGAAAAPGADPAQSEAVPAGAPGTTDELVAGAIKHDSPLETLVAGGQ